MITQKAAFAKCRKIGFAVSKTEGGDFRLCPKGKSEKSAYYTTNLDDLVDTAVNWKRNHETSERSAPLEHRFDEFDSRKDYDKAVFLNATHFTTFRMHSGRHRRDHREFKTFPEAVKDAEKDRRALLYAVTKTGRDICIDTDDWPHYMKIWEENNKPKVKRKRKKTKTKKKPKQR